MMSNTTTKLQLIQPTVDDDIQQSIEWLSDNFKIIDDNYDETISDISAFPTVGATYQSGKKFWNRVPTLNGYAGWTNIRAGVFAKKWKTQSTYNAGDIVSVNSDNGHYYECITGGTSAVLEPVFPTTSGTNVEDLTGSTAWVASYTYALDDIIFSTVGDKSYYHKCITAGTTGDTEPSWINVSGSTIDDGSVTWYAYKTVVWQEKGASCEFIKFGLVGEQAPSTPSTPTGDVGTVTTGIWNATPIALAHGGTGSTNAKDARATLGATGKYSANVGDGASTTLVVAHNLGTKDVVVSVRETITPSGIVPTEIAIIDNNTLTVTFGTPPTINQYRVTVIG